jgi:hypothetical protein
LRSVPPILFLKVYITRKYSNFTRLNISKPKVKSTNNRERNGKLAQFIVVLDLLMHG